jgi:transcriptional regulator with XRE-family HTH domain
VSIGSDLATEIVATIARRCAELRSEYDLSLQDVADRAGLSKSHIWDLEQGRQRNPTIDTAIRLASAFGVSLDSLIGKDSKRSTLHPEAMRIACEVDAILRRKKPSTK